MHIMFVLLHTDVDSSRRRCIKRARNSKPDSKDSVDIYILLSYHLSIWPIKNRKYWDKNSKYRVIIGSFIGMFVSLYSVEFLL